MLYLQGNQKASSKTKPLDSVTYDYSTEWVLCGKNLKQKVSPGLAIAFNDFPVCVVRF